MRKSVLILLLLFGLEVLTLSQEVELPEVPHAISDPQQRIRYMSENFWQVNDIGDTLLMSQPTAMMDYLYLLSKLPQEEAEVIASRFVMASISYQETLSSVIYWLETFLHDALSPFYNDVLFVYMMNQILSSEIDELLKMRPKYLHDIASLNLPGQVAKDIMVQSSDGHGDMLSAINGEYIVVCFLQNECAACKAAEEYLTDSDVVKVLKKSGRVVFVKVDCSDDALIRGESYELQYFPSFYILDSKHNVLQKEVSLDRLHAFLTDLLNR